MGRKPAKITHAQWGTLLKLHLNLAHPPASNLMARLRKYGATQAVIDAVKAIKCRACEETTLPPSSRSAAYRHCDQFNENLFIDEFQVTLPEGSRVLLLMMLDDASSFRVVVPTKAARTISGKEAKLGMERQ